MALENSLGVFSCSAAPFREWLLQASAHPRSRQHNVRDVKEFMRLVEAFHFQRELALGPGESRSTGHEAELWGQATPSICLRDSRWRIQGIKSVLAVTSQIHEDPDSRQDLNAPHPGFDKQPQRKPRAPSHCPLKCGHTEAEPLPCSGDSPNGRKPCEPTLADGSWMNDSRPIFTSIEFMLPLVSNLHLYRLFQTLGSKMALLVYMLGHSFVSAVGSVCINRT